MTTVNLHHIALGAALSAALLFPGAAPAQSPADQFAGGGPAVESSSPESPTPPPAVAGADSPDKAATGEETAKKTGKKTKRAKQDGGTGDGAAAAASPCKGLAESACRGTSECVWIVPEKPVAKTGKPRSAYCRKRNMATLKTNQGGATSKGAAKAPESAITPKTEPNKEPSP